MLAPVQQNVGHVRYILYQRPNENNPNKILRCIKKLHKRYIRIPSGKFSNVNPKSTIRARELVNPLFSFDQLHIRERKSDTNFTNTSRQFPPIVALLRAPIRIEPHQFPNNHHDASTSQKKPLSYYKITTHLINKALHASLKTIRPHRTSPSCFALPKQTFPDYATAKRKYTAAWAQHPALSHQQTITHRLHTY